MNQNQTNFRVERDRDSGQYQPSKGYRNSQERSKEQLKLKLQDRDTNQGNNDPVARFNQYPNQRQQQPDDRGHRDRPRATNRTSNAVPDARPEMEEELDLKYGAHHVIMLFTPISLCLMVVVAVVASVTYYTENSGVYLVYTPFHETSDDAGTIAWHAFANAGIFLVVVVVMTCLLVLAYKHGCYRLMHTWLLLSTVLILSIFSFIFLSQVLQTYNVAMDYITLAFIMWNFGVVGMISIHWKGPLLVQQAYLILISAIMALIFIKYLPNFTLWIVLAVISLWDLFAVLAPCGPLRILVELAQERNEQLFPALIYTAGIVYSIMGTTSGDESLPSRPPRSKGASRRPSSNDSNEGFNQQWIEMNDNAHRRAEERNGPVNVPPRLPPTEEEVEDQGIKLGLGDFIFYSILVGKASSYGDWNTTVACFVAILVGLCLTLMCLAIFKRALPALPISIAFGLVFYFATSLLITPFVDTLSSAQIFL